MIFLNDNTLLKRELTFNDIKPRLLGEFNLVYSSMGCFVCSQGLLLQVTGEHVPASSWSIPT